MRSRRAFQQIGGSVLDADRHRLARYQANIGPGEDCIGPFILPDLVGRRDANRARGSVITARSGNAVAKPRARVLVMCSHDSARAKPCRAGSALRVALLQDSQPERGGRMHARSSAAPPLIRSSRHSIAGRRGSAARVDFPAGRPHGSSGRSSSHPLVDAHRGAREAGRPTRGGGIFSKSVARTTAPRPARRPASNRAAISRCMAPIRARRWSPADGGRGRAGRDLSSGPGAIRIRPTRRS